MSAEEPTEVNEEIKAVKEEIAGYIEERKNAKTAEERAEATSLINARSNYLAVLIARLPQVQAAATAAAAATTALPPIVAQPLVLDIRSIVSDHAIADLDAALAARSLPFKIPVMDSKWVQHFPNELCLGRTGYEYSVDAWLSRNIQFVSETSVTSLDQNWINVLYACQDGIVPYLNQHDPSSAVRIRPDTTLMKNGALLLKGEAKFDAADLEAAKSQLSDSFFQGAVRCFPVSCRAVIGVTTSSTLVKIYTIRWDGNRFQTMLYDNYDVGSQVSDRLKFIVDIFKAALWMVTVQAPVDSFHLVPSVRQKTRNGHHITWCKDGILKEYRHSNKHMVSRILDVYRCNLAHVEWGHAVPDNDSAIMITRVAVRLAHALASGTITSNAAIADIRSAVNELHGVGFAHCDIVVDNVFVDNGGAFLGDLEYLTPVNDPAPINSRWTPSKHPNLKAGELDEILLGSFAKAVYSL